MAILKSKKALPGVRLKHIKHTASSTTALLPIPAEVTIPLCQHIGAPAEPLVKAGDPVLVGQKLGDSEKPNSVPIHASVSGTVKGLVDILGADGRMGKAIVITADGAQIPAPCVIPTVSNREEFIAAVRESGLVGLGGAGFPTHLKLAYREIDKVDTLIINAAECEPYITADHRECIEHTQDVLDGISLVMKHLGLSRCVIGIEKNKPDVIALLGKAAASFSGVAVMPLKNSYPQGAEKVLIYSVTGKVVEEGQLPADCGVLVLNVTTVASLARYFKTGMPLVSKRLTVDGDAVECPQNIEVPLGTPIKAVLAHCGLKESVGEVLMGGPMMGIAVADLSQPVLKNNNAILAFQKPQASYTKTTACIRCGKCVRACPMKLTPAALERAYDNRNSEALKQLRVNLCINCGCCSYVCPAKRELAAKNQLGKQLLRELK